MTSDGVAQFSIFANAVLGSYLSVQWYGHCETAVIVLTTEHEPIRRARQLSARPAVNKSIVLLQRRLGREHRQRDERAYEYVAFDYDSQNGDMSHTETVVAIKTSSPKTPDTSLSRASGLQLERVGEWIFAFEARHIVSRSKIEDVIDDIINLLEYAKGFPQST